MGSQTQSVKGRVAILSSVKNVLGFFVLVVLICESGLFFLARANSQSFVLIVAMMVFLILAAIGSVVYLTIKAPGDLLGTSGSAGKENSQFLRTIEGTWWEFLTPEKKGAALSSVNIVYDRLAGSVTLEGTSYYRPGAGPPDERRFATWHGILTRSHGATVHYSWWGDVLTDMSDFEGFGKFSFDPRARTAGGSYIEVNRTKLTVEKTIVTLRQASRAELRMQQKLPVDEFVAAILKTRDSLH